ncbi:MAG: hypothetical protein LBI72_00145 [Flavobacteriaceae bacterium]|jgi:hypothetical protein|nr:hypothetical protein [Flavobacteriaceae bacterium]
MSDTKIILDLGDSSNAKNFKVENIIHRGALEKVKGFIKDFQEANDKALAESEQNGEEKLSYKHNTITILGTRGSGKTSFLLSIEEAIKKNKDIRHNDLLFLEIIDPTLVEEKGHVFLNVISSICDEVKVVLDKREANLSDDVKCTRKHWKESMNKLAKGLPSIDGIGNSKFGEWQDAEFVMQNELQAIHSARNLAKYFAEFVKQSLKILDKKQFVLFFDDIDVDSSKGYAVLETIRKYFVSDQLISFLSGDLKLYDALVRDKKWNNFGTKLITFETSTDFQNENRRQANMNHYNDIVTDLTSQYLIKIMQPKYRIHLFNLYDYGMSTNIYVKSNIEGENDETLEDFLKILFKEFGIKSELQRATFVEFLLHQPLRSVIHFLQYFTKNINKEGSKGNVSTDFVSVFLSDLYEKHVDINALQNSSTYFIPNVLQTLVREQKLRESYQLIPATLDNSFNAMLFTSSLLFSNHVNKGSKFLVFEYFFKIAYLRNFVNKEEDFKSIELVLKVSGILTDNVFRDSCNQLQSSLLGQFGATRKANEFGMLPLYGLASKARKSESEVKNRIDYVFSISVNSLQRYLGFLPCFIGQYSRKNATEVFYSVVSLFSTIGELSKRYERKILNKKNFITTLSEVSQIRYYAINENFNIRENSKHDEGDDSNSIDDNENVQYSSIEDKDVLIFRDLLFYWFEKGNINEVSPYLLGKIFTRFHYSLISIGEDKDSKLGKSFSLQILAFFNAIIIEEAREENIADINFNYDNIVSSSKIFQIHFSKVLHEIAEGKLPLTNWIITCPVFSYYVELDIVLMMMKSGIISDSYNYTHIKNNNIVELLNKVDIDNQLKTNVKKSPVNKGIRNKKILDELKNVVDKDGLYEMFPSGSKGYLKEKVDVFFSKYSNILDKYNISETKERSALTKFLRNKLLEV